MKKLGIFIFIIGIISIRYNLSEEFPSMRIPASETQEAIKSVQKVCDQSRQNDSTFILCRPYKNAKDVVKKETDKVMEVIKDTLPDSITAVSGFLLKCLYEQKIQLDVKTPIGSPGVSISSGETNLVWKFDYNF